MRVALCCAGGAEGCVLQPLPGKAHVPGDFREVQEVAGHHTVLWAALSEQEEIQVFLMF